MKLAQGFPVYRLETNGTVDLNHLFLGWHYSSKKYGIQILVFKYQNKKYIYIFILHLH